MKKRVYFEISADETIENYSVFNGEANILAKSYEQTADTQFKNIQKVRIELKATTTEFAIYEPVSKLFPICFICSSFDFDNYFKQNQLERHKIVLETLYTTVVSMCNKLNIDKTPFVYAYQKKQPKLLFSLAKTFLQISFYIIIYQVIIKLFANNLILFFFL